MQTSEDAGNWPRQNVRNGIQPITSATPENHSTTCIHQFPFKFPVNNKSTYDNISYLPKILETQPLETCSILDMSQGRAPEWANSTIFCLVESGKGRPLTNTPPSWFTPLCPSHSYTTVKNFTRIWNFCYFIETAMEVLLWKWSDTK